jgi:hypothetical protein
MFAIKLAEVLLRTVLMVVVLMGERVHRRERDLAGAV